MRKEFKVGDKVQGTQSCNYYIVTAVHANGTFDARRIKDNFVLTSQDPNWFTFVHSAVEDAPTPAPIAIPFPLEAGVAYSYTDAAGNVLVFKAQQINARLEHGRVTLTLDTKPR